MAQQESGKESNALHPAIKINLHDRVKDPELWAEADQFEGKPGVAYVFGHGSYVFGHGSSDHIADNRKGKNHLLPADLALMLQEHGATGTTRVMLDSCDTGMGQHSFARELSHYFEVVEAPTRKSWSGASDHESLMMTSVSGELAKSDPDDKSKQDHNNHGRWKEFHSEDYAYCKEHPECDTPESELPGKGTVYDTKTGHYLDAKNLGDEKPITNLNSPYALSPRVGLDDLKRQRDKFKEYREEMVAQYHDASNANNPKKWADVIEQYPLIAVAYNTREAMLKMMDDKNAAQAGVDGYIAGMIMNGKVRELMTHQPQIDLALGK